MNSKEVEAVIRTRAYICSRWEAAVHKPENEPDDGFRLPYPFVPPCIAGDFHSLFYWDTFYTNRGMIADGHFDLAKWNVDNLIYTLEKLGFVPNAYNANLIRWCSQPPYLHFMVMDIARAKFDSAWLQKAYLALKKEYDFWMNKRIAPNGLNRHFHNPLPQEELVDYYRYVALERLGLSVDKSEKEMAHLGECYVADAEAGLDFTPRFLDRGIYVNPVDLNANLYGMELDLAALAEQFEPEEQTRFLTNAQSRKQKMDRYMLAEDGLYYDYDFDRGCLLRPDFCFTGQFMPFITGLSDSQEAARKALERLLYPFGVVSTQKDPSETIAYQAAYPYSWPYDNYLVYWGLRSIGMDKEAKEVGERWLRNVSQCFLDTGKLWETYDPLQGGRAKKKEYPANEMMGWTAGTISSIAEDLHIK